MFPFCKAEKDFINQSVLEKYDRGCHVGVPCPVDAFHRVISIDKILFSIRHQETHGGKEREPCHQE